MKRLVKISALAALAVSLAFSTVACSDGDDDDETTPTVETPTTDPNQNNDDSNDNGSTTDPNQNNDSSDNSSTADTPAAEPAVSATYDFKNVTADEVKALGASGLTDGSTALSDGTVLDGAVKIVSGSKFKLKTDSNKGIVTGIIIGTNTFTGDTTATVVNAGLEVGGTANISKYIEYTAPSTGTYDLVLSYAMNAASGGASDAKYYITVEDENNKILGAKLYATGDYAAATDLSETFAGLSLTKDQKVRVTFLRGASKGGLIVNSLAFNAKN